MKTIVRLALVAFFPRSHGLPGLAELGVDAKIDALRRESSRLFWLGVVVAAVVFQLSPVVTVHRPLPAALLSEEALDRHTNRLATFPVYAVRQLVLLLKLVAGLFWGESPEVRAFLNLPAYGIDPGTRRTERRVSRTVPGERAPTSHLVQLGQRELARGRGGAA